MKSEEAKSFLKKKIAVNDAVIKEARKNKDLNIIELTNDLDTESKAIKTVLQALDNSISKDKLISLIKEELPDDEICATCNIYDVNGIEIKKKLQELLEDK